MLNFIVDNVDFIAINDKYRRMLWKKISLPVSTTGKENIYISTYTKGSYKTVMVWKRDTFAKNIFMFSHLIFINLFLYNYHIFKNYTIVNLIFSKYI